MRKLLRSIIFTIIILSVINVSYSDEPSQITPTNAPLQNRSSRYEFQAINIAIYISFFQHQLQGDKNVSDGVDENVSKSNENFYSNNEETQHEPNPPSPTNAPLHNSSSRHEFHAINVAIYISLFQHDLQGDKNVSDGVFSTKDSQTESNEGSYEDTQHEPNPPSPTKAPLHNRSSRHEFHAINIAIYISFSRHELQGAKNVSDGVDENVHNPNPAWEDMAPKIPNTQTEPNPAREDMFSKIPNRPTKSSPPSHGWPNIPRENPHRPTETYHSWLDRTWDVIPGKAKPNPAWADRPYKPSVNNLPKIPNRPTKPSPPSHSRPNIPRENPHRPTETYHSWLDRTWDVIPGNAKPNPAWADRPYILSVNNLPKIPNRPTKPSPPSHGRPCIPWENPYTPSKPYHPWANKSWEVIHGNAKPNPAREDRLLNIPNASVKVEAKPKPAWDDRFCDLKENPQTQTKPHLPSVKRLPKDIRTETPAGEDSLRDFQQRPQMKKKSVLAKNPILSPLSAISHGIGVLVQDGMETIHNTTKSGTQGIKYTAGKFLDAIGNFGK